jgi:hypothetical protein
MGKKDFVRQMVHLGGFHREKCVIIILVIE